MVCSSLASKEESRPSLNYSNYMSPITLYRIYESKKIPLFLHGQKSFNRHISNNTNYNKPTHNNITILHMNPFMNNIITTKYLYRSQENNSNVNNRKTVSIRRSIISPVPNASFPQNFHQQNSLHLNEQSRISKDGILGLSRMDQSPAYMADGFDPDKDDDVTDSYNAGVDADEDPPEYEFTPVKNIVAEIPTLDVGEYCSID